MHWDLLHEKDHKDNINVLLKAVCYFLVQRHWISQEIAVQKLLLFCYCLRWKRVLLFLNGCSAVLQLTNALFPIQEKSRDCVWRMYHVCFWYSKRPKHYKLIFRFLQSSILSPENTPIYSFQNEEPLHQVFNRDKDFLWPSIQGSSIFLYIS